MARESRARFSVFPEARALRVHSRLPLSLSPSFRRRNQGSFFLRQDIDSSSSRQVDRLTMSRQPSPALESEQKHERVRKEGRGKEEKVSRQEKQKERREREFVRRRPAAAAAVATLAVRFLHV